jgi:hypothetical protein
MIALTMAQMAEKNKAKEAKTGGGSQVENPLINLFPRGQSLLTMPPIGYQVVGSQGNNIPAAALGSGGNGGGAYMSMDQANMAQMGGDPTLDPGYKEGDYIPQSSGQPSGGQPSTAGGPTDLIPWPDQQQPTNPQRLPKTPEEMAHEVELQKMSDKNAMIRQGLSSAGTFLGTMMKPPSAVTVGGYRPNPALQMFRRRRGLMGG